MLKQIPSSQLVLGMHLNKLTGKWLDHPFWRTNFVLTEPDDIRQIIASGIREVWIDVAKGHDVGQVHAAVANAATPTAAPAPARPVPAAVPATVSVAAEAARAEALCKKAASAVKALHTEARLGNAIDVETCLPLVDEISASLQRNAQALISVSRLKLRDEYTYMHSVSVCALMVALGRQLGLGEEEVRVAGLAGLLHDMGKAAVPLEVLNKPGKLTDEEFAVMRNHPAQGHALLIEAGIEVPGVLDVCLHHHERIDGKGYPQRLKGDELSLLTRMGAVCDVYDAITSDRPYKKGWEPGESLRRMAQWEGHFDPAVFQSFVKAVGIYPTGSLVKLQSGRLAMVVEQDPSRLTAPKVRAFFSTKSNMRTVPEMIELASPHCKDKIVNVESPGDWQFNDLKQLWTSA